MLALLVQLSCFLLFVVGGEIDRDLFLADMTCRYCAYHLSHWRWDSEPLRLKENRQAYIACATEIFQPHYIEFLAEIFTDIIRQRHEVYVTLAAEYVVIASKVDVLKIFSYDYGPDEPILVVTKPHSVIVCNGSNGNTFARRNIDGLLDEVVFLNYTKGVPSVEHIAERRAAFQQRVIPEATVESLIAFYHQRLARCPSVLLESALPKKTGTVELRLNRIITDYSPAALGADFVTEFGLLYHLNRSSSLVDSNEKMLEGLCRFFPELSVFATLSYMPRSGLDVFKVPWAPPFHSIPAHHPRLVYRWPVDGLPDDPWFPVTSLFDEVIFPDYSKQNFVMCRLGQAKMSPSGTLFAMLAKVTVKNPPGTSSRRLLIAHLLRTAYSSDIFDPATKRRYDSIDWYFGAQSVNEYVERMKKEKTVG